MSKAATPEQFNHLACQIATVTVTKRYENVFGQGECCLLLQYSFKCQVYFRYVRIRLKSWHFILFIVVMVISILLKTAF